MASKKEWATVVIMAHACHDKLDRQAQIKNSIPYPVELPLWVKNLPGLHTPEKLDDFVNETFKIALERMVRILVKEEFESSDDCVQSMMKMTEEVERIARDRGWTKEP